MNIVTLGQLILVGCIETRQMSVLAAEGICHVSAADICPVSTADICFVATEDISLVSTADIFPAARPDSRLVSKHIADVSEISIVAISPCSILREVVRR